MARAWVHKLNVKCLIMSITFFVVDANHVPIPQFRNLQMKMNLLKDDKSLLKRLQVALQQTSDWEPRIIDDTGTDVLVEDVIDLVKTLDATSTLTFSVVAPLAIVAQIQGASAE